MSDQVNNDSSQKEQTKTGSEQTSDKNPDMSNILSHIKNLEVTKQELEKALKAANERNSKLSEKTRQGMQSALDTLMKKWMDAVETKNDSVKDEFRSGLERLVNQSAEDNGVWQVIFA